MVEDGEGGEDGESIPPVWGKDAKWCILSQREGEMRNMAKSRGQLGEREWGMQRWWWW